MAGAQLGMTLKRALDITAAALGLTLLLPVLIVVARGHLARIERPDFLRRQTRGAGRPRVQVLEVPHDVHGRAPGAAAS